MSDIFDQIAPEQTNQSEAIKPISTDVFDQIQPEEPSLENVTQEPDKFTIPEKAKEVVKAFARMPQRVGGQIGNLMEWAADYRPEKSWIPPERLAGKLMETIKPQWMKTMDEAARNTTRKYGEQISSYWQKAAETGWEGPSTEYLESTWSSAPITKALAGAAENSGSFLGSVAAAYVTKSPQLGILMLSGLAGGQTYKAFKEQNKIQPVDQEVAQNMALFTAAFEGLTEEIPFDMIFNQTSKNALKQFLKVGTAEGLQEFIQGLGENFLQYFGYNYKRDWNSIPVAVKEGVAHLLDNWLDNVTAGFIMGGAAGGGVNMLSQRNIKSRIVTPESTPVEQIQNVEDVRSVIQESTALTPEQKEEGLRYVGDIETKVVEQVVDRFPDEITDQASLERVGNQIKNYLGVDANIKWRYDTTKTTRNKGWHIFRSAEGIHDIKIRGNFVGGSQDQMKRTLVHELGHIVEAPDYGPSGKRLVHHKQFKSWVESNVKRLYETRQIIEPVHREEAIGEIKKPGESKIIEKEYVPKTQEELEKLHEEFYAEARGVEHRLNEKGYVVDEKGNTVFDPTKAFALIKQRKGVAGTSPAAEVPKAEIGQERGEVFSGEAYRAEVFEPSEFEVKGRTAKDIIDHEVNYLGNKYTTGKALETAKKMNVDLSKIPASRLLWVTKTEEEAMNYGGAEKVKIPDGSIILAKDPDGGYLIMKPSPAVSEKPTIEELRIPKPSKQPGEEKPRGLTRKQALKLGHNIPNVMGWTDAQRRDFMNKLTGKTSMKGMSLEEMRSVVEGLQAEATKAGFELVGPEKPAGVVNDLITTLQTTKPKITETEEYNPSRWRRFVHGFKKVTVGKVGEILGMPQRFFEALDGRKPDGVFQRLIYRPLVEKSALSRINAHEEQMELVDFLLGMDIKNISDMWQPRKIKGTKHKLTTMERLGVFGHSQNEFGHGRLLKAGFTEEDISTIGKSVTPDEIKLYDFIMNKFESQWKPLVNAAVQAGWDIKQLKKEFGYMPIEEINARIRKDFVDQLADFAAGEPLTPESRMLLLRVPGAKGRINLDLAMLYMNNAIRVQRFIQMAPLAKSLRSIMYNQNFTSELNNRTYGQGTKILSDYISTKIRGGIRGEGGALERVFSLLRKKATAFAAGRNVLMTMRQPLALFTTMADSPALIPYVIKNTTFASMPHGGTKLTEFVNTRSLLMKDRDIGRDVQKFYNRQRLVKTVKKHLSGRSLNWYAAADKSVANIAWKSYYDYSMDKLNPGDEKAALVYADSRITKTQSLVHKEDLPGLYRGGELSQQIAVFTRELATLGNYWAHDVYGAKIRGEIGWTKFGYRIMMSQIIPALVFGMIARGRPPKSWKEAGQDLLVYTVAPSIFLGGLVNRLLTGLDSGMIAWSGYEGLYGILQQAKKLPRWNTFTDEQKASTIRLLIRKSAITLGAITGKITAQDIRTLEGAWDLITQKTKDPRRLIWSEYALKKGEKTEEVELNRSR